MAAPLLYIVDDDPAVAASLRRLLAPLRRPLRTFGSAEQFLAAADGSARGCLILDVRLPGMSGLELQQRMAEQGWELPVIFVTAQGDDASRDAALGRGAVGYLSKPFRCDQLLELARGALSRPPTA